MPIAASTIAKAIAGYMYLHRVYFHVARQPDAWTIVEQAQAKCMRDSGLSQANLAMCVHAVEQHRCVDRLQKDMALRPYECYYCTAMALSLWMHWG